MTSVAAVVIPVHNGAGTLACQLDALANQTGAPDFEVVVVLNRCTDDSATIAQSFSSRLKLRVVEANRLPSAAYARNVGVAETTAQVLLFCDSDDRVAADWVAKMVSAIQSGGADFVGGRIVVDRSGLPDWIYEWRYLFFDGQCTLIGPAALPYGLSASLACRRDAFDNVNGFDEGFLGAGSEEVDLAARLLRTGSRIGEVPEAVVHYRPRTTVREVLRQTRGYARGQTVLEAREMKLGPPVSRFGISKRLVRMTLNLTLRQREWRPHVLFCLVMERFYRFEERRLWWENAAPSSDTPPGAEDFVVPLSTRLIGGLALSARPARARWYGSVGIERHSLALVDALLPEGGVFVDCGANIGAFSLAAALRVGREGRVIAFEPDPRSHSLLEQNLRRHNVVERVELRSEGVGDVAGRSPFHLYENDLLSGFGTEPEQFTPGEIVATTLVDVVPLTAAVEQRVDMIKIDVEGFESSVLQGAQGLLKRCPDATLMVELNPAALRSAGRTPEDLLQHFSRSHWALWLVEEDPPPGVDAIRVFDDTARSFVAGADVLWYANLLAVPMHRAAEIANLIDGLQ